MDTFHSPVHAPHSSRSVFQRTNTFLVRFLSICTILSATLLTGCSGNVADSMAHTIRERLAKQPYIETVSLSSPRTITVYGADGEQILEDARIVPDSSTSQKREIAALSVLVDHHLLSKTQARAFYTKRDGSWHVPIRLNPKAYHDAVTALNANRAAIPTEYVTILRNVPHYFRSASIVWYTVRFPSQNPKDYFYAEGPDNKTTPAEHAALVALVAHGYLRSHRVRAYAVTHTGPGAYIGTIKGYHGHAPKVSVTTYFLTRKGHEFLHTSLPPYNQGTDRIMAAAVASTTPDYESHPKNIFEDQGRSLYFYVSYKPTPPFLLRAVERAISPKDDRNIQTLLHKRAFASLLFSNHRDVGKNHNISRLYGFTLLKMVSSTGHRTLITLYAYTPTKSASDGNSGPALSAGTLTVGQWTFGKVTNYSTHTVHLDMTTGRLLDFTLVFHPYFKPKELAALQPILNGDIPAPGSAMKSECLLQRMAHGWRLIGCQGAMSGYY